MFHHNIRRIDYWRNLLIKFSHWLLPTVCTFCRDPTADSPLCLACYQQLPWLGNACLSCARHLPSGAVSAATICGHCLTEPPLYHTIIAAFAYAAPINQAVLALKFNHQLQFAQLLGELLANVLQTRYIAQEKPQIIIPVPLHKQRLQERGYNQALEIARPIAKKLQIPLKTHFCSRPIATAPQANLPAKQRQHNVKNAFVIDLPITATHVAIVDDVVTTGNTVTELTRQLKLVGVKRIDVWCCARTFL